jgi:diadenylate cyclase
MLYLAGIPSKLAFVLDLAIVWYLLYRGLLLIRGTRAVPMLIGLTCIGAGYLIARPLGLVTVAWLLDSFLSSIILVVVVIFQDEIRRTLMKVGGANRLIFKTAREQGPEYFEEIALAVAKLAREKIGSIIVLERSVGLDEFLEEGVILNARLSSKLLYGIFVKGSPLHDGAVVVNGKRLKAAGVVLPLSSNPDIDPSFGTRHRAALGITERSDALVIVVSEERGSITVFTDGKVYQNINEGAIGQFLQKHSHDSLGVTLR